MTLPGIDFDNDRANYRKKEREQEIALVLLKLNSTYATTRAEAAKRLGELQADAETFVTLLSDSDAKVRTAAAIGLGNANADSLTTNAIETLLAAIDDPDDRVCAAAINSLGKLGVEIAREQIAPFLDDQNPYILESAIIASARLGLPELGPKILPYLKSNNRFIKAITARALAIIKYAPASDELLVGLQEMHLRGFEQDWRACGAYIQALGELQVHEATPLLIEIAQRDVGLRSKAISALTVLRAEEATPLLVPMLADPGEKLRASLIKLIIETNYQPALPAVRVLLLDETMRSRNLALAAVKEMNDHDSVKQVRWMCYHDPSPYTRSFALNVLYSLLGAESLPDLLLLAKDTNSNVRRDVVLYLSKISPLPIDAVASLHELAHDPILGIQQTALAILTSLEQQNILVEEIVLPIQPLESLFPPEMSSDLPYLLAILQKWQDSLERKHPTENSVEMDRTIDAIAHLIELLIASHDGNVRG